MEHLTKVKGWQGQLEEMHAHRVARASRPSTECGNR